MPKNLLGPGKSIQDFAFIISFLLLILSVQLSTAQIYRKREVRAAWIATVKNIDWPSAPGLPVISQKKEAIRLLDSLVNSGINTVYLQVRSSADALYAFSQEPWAEWLNGVQGKAPSPFYDPLSFYIEEAHSRGMEIHAWINPYRAIFNNAQSQISTNHITHKHPDWFFKYDGKTLFNPGLKSVRLYIDSLVMNLIDHYDLDGIHMDDYFYPYPVKGKAIPDYTTYRELGMGEPTLISWRRANIDSLVEGLYRTIKSRKPYVKFGISPFGIWRNKSQDSLGSETNGGATYDNQFADTRKWIQKGWVDYLVPQIYFGPENSLVPFFKALDWWNKNAFNRQIFIGLGLYRLGDKRDGWAQEGQLEEEIRECQAGAKISGMAFYSAHYFLLNRLGFKDSLKKNTFRYKAIPPTMPWIDSLAPIGPTDLRGDTLKKGVFLEWDKALKTNDPRDSSSYYLIYRFLPGQELNTEMPEHIIGLVYKNTCFIDSLTKGHQSYLYLVTGLDRSWNESRCTNVLLIKSPGRKEN